LLQPGPGALVVTTPGFACITFAEEILDPTDESVRRPSARYTGADQSS